MRISAYMFWYRVHAGCRSTFTIYEYRSMFTTYIYVHLCLSPVYVQVADQRLRHTYGSIYEAAVYVQVTHHYDILIGAYMQALGTCRLLINV